jgi:SAM-dependent methyltransferase
MPIVRDLDKLYVGPDDYFVHHDPKNKVKCCTQLLRELEVVLTYKGRILDVGCGRGEMLSAAKSLGWNAQGVEPSHEFSDLARRRYGVEVRNCSLEAAKYPDNYFDVVTLAAVMEHLYYPKQMLIEVNRILRPGGLLWMDAPNEASLFNHVGNFYFRIQGKNWVTHLAPTFSPYHVQGFTRKSITILLQRVGFTAERFKVYSGPVLLPHRTLKEHGEYYGARAICKLADLVNLGPYMEITAKKTSPGTASVCQ